MNNTKPTTPIDEAMRLASLYATARCVRLTASKSNDAVKLAQAEVRVAKAERTLRKYLEKLS